MTENKKEFVTRVKLVLISDPRSHVDDVVYLKTKDGEFIVITFIGGSRKVINVNCNSNGANFLEIGRAVYGSGAIGECHNVEFVGGILND